MATMKTMWKRQLNTNKINLPEESKRVKWLDSSAPTVSAVEWPYR
jgi:hypothetical protein